MFNLAAGRKRTVLLLAIQSACVAQFAILTYDPSHLIPSEKDWRAGEQLVERLASIDGPVLLPSHAYLAGQAGKAIYMQGNATGDIFRGREGPIRSRLIQEYADAIRTQTFDAIILEPSGLLSWTHFWPLFREDIGASYVPRDPIIERDDVFWTVTGARSRPEIYLVPRRSTAEPRP